MQSPIINPQSTICNPQSSIRHNPTECGQIQRKFVRARVPFIHARTRAHEELAQKRGQGAPRAPSHVIPAKAGIYPQTPPFPHPPTSFPTPSTSFPTPSTSFPRRRESSAPQSTICNQQFPPSHVISPTLPLSFPPPFVIPAPTHVIPAKAGIWRDGGDAYSLAIHASTSNRTRAAKNLTSRQGLWYKTMVASQ